jgi:hypothetical protein
MTALTPGRVKRRLHVGRGEDRDSQRPFQRGDLLVEEGDLAQAGVDRFEFVDRQRLGRQPGQPAAPEQVAHRLAWCQVADQRGMDLVLGAADAAGEPTNPRRLPLVVSAW